MSLNEEILKLKNKISELEKKINDLSLHTEEKTPPPYTKVGRSKSRGLISPSDIVTGMGGVRGNFVVWNDSELSFPPYSGAEPELPTKGYNKHSHSRYDGGALIKDVLEIVEYDWGAIQNKYCQQFMKTPPKIATTTNTNGQTVQKIGPLDLVFDPDTLKWGASAFEIDVKKCYFVIRDENGDIEKDERNNPKRALLLNENDEGRTSLIWDKDGQCWRVLAVYSD